MPSQIDHPVHYTSLPAVCRACGSPIECIDVVQHLGFSVGNAIKYLWRAGLKGDAAVDLEKAAWYIAHEIGRLRAPKKPKEARRG